MTRWVVGFFCELAGGKAVAVFSGNGQKSGQIDGKK